MRRLFHIWQICITHTNALTSFMGWLYSGNLCSLLTWIDGREPRTIIILTIYLASNLKCLLGKRVVLATAQARAFVVDLQQCPIHHQRLWQHMSPRCGGEARAAKDWRLVALADPCCACQLVIQQLQCPVAGTSCEMSCSRKIGRFGLGFNSAASSLFYSQYSTVALFLFVWVNLEFCAWFRDGDQWPIRFTTSQTCPAFSVATWCMPDLVVSFQFW